MLKMRSQRIVSSQSSLTVVVPDLESTRAADGQDVLEDGLARGHCCHSVDMPASICALTDPLQVLTDTPGLLLHILPSTVFMMFAQAKAGEFIVLESSNQFKYCRAIPT